VVRGGTYVIGNHNDLVNFDTATLGGGIKLSVMGLVQSGLRTLRVLGSGSGLYQHGPA